MAEQSGFFDAHLIGGEYDRTYLASSFARYFSSFIGNGVFAGKSDELMVYQTAPTGMGVKVLPGQAWINGYWYENDNEFSLPIDVADGVLNRIDLVVLRWGTTERSINLAVKRGTPAVNALPPAIQRDSDYYELKLAEIQVSAGTAKITQSNIVDTRTDTNVCGWVTGVIKQADTSDLFAQWQTAYEAEYNKVQAYYEEQKAAWERFFASIAEDSVFPVPSLDDVGKIPVINESANGYELKDILSLKGLNLGGSLNMNGNKLVGLPLPTTASEPATKEFVENFTVEGSLEFRAHTKNKNNPHMITPEQIKAVSLEGLRKLAYSQTDANGAITKALISSYPTSPGVYRVGDNTGLGIPESWGTLIIFDGGGCIGHIFVNLNGLWFAKTDETYTVTAWTRVQDWLFSDSNGTFIDKYGRNWNPEFVFGTEYITEERWNNSGVYKKWLNLGKLGTAGSTISVSHGITRTWITGVRGIAVIPGGNALEMVNGGSNGSVFVSDDKIQWHCSIDLSSYNGYVEITYTKA